MLLLWEFRVCSRGGRLRGRNATISGRQDHELYRRILGIESPWYVNLVELKLELGEIHVHGIRSLDTSKNRS
jgi:hypothetical protein